MIKTAKNNIPPEDPYKNLALAIVERAVIDYRIAVRSKDYTAKRELCKFFTSDWFAFLCDLDGEVLMNSLEAMEEDVA